ncbi:DNA primase large subunit Spp2 [Naganishia albida]|nr:DNA primase large subunit Spp2 [Naganishia albida]
MSAPISFTVRPPSRPPTPSSSSAPSSAPNSREQSATPDEPRSGLPPRQGIRISAAPSRPSPLGPSRSGPRPGTGVRDRYGRMTFSRDEGESDDDEEGGFRVKGRGKVRDEEIVGFGEGGAESKSTTKPKGPLVIPSLPNRDWRQSSMSARKPTYIPESRRGVADTTVEREGDEPVRAGLQIVSHSVNDNAPVVKSEFSETVVAQEEKPSAPETIEQRAMRELMISAENGGEEANAHKDMVIGLQNDALNLRDLPVDETDAYRRDVLTRPEVSTLDDYSEVPIEAFGEAMLRGMGWRPDAPSSAPGVHAPQRRPEGLGLGATARAAPLDDKGKKAKRKEDAKSRGGRGYVPVVKRERDTPSDSRNGSPATSSSLREGRPRPSGRL